MGVRVEDGDLLPFEYVPELSCDGVGVGEADNDSSFVSVTDGLALMVGSRENEWEGEALRV